MTNVQAIDMGEQAKRAHQKWIAAKVSKVDPALVEANVAGFEAGWRAAISTMKLHGALKLSA